MITIPESAAYNIMSQINMQQGNDNKEIACLLWLRSSVLGDLVIDSMQISDDKTDWRSLGATFGYNAQAGETLQLGLSRINGSMGSCSIQTATFEVNLIIPADLNEVG